MKTVAITGGTGFIGHHVLPLLLERGCRVRALARAGSAHVLPAGVEAVAGDITDPTAVMNLITGCDTVLHLAGQAHTDLRTPEDRNRAMDVNVGGASNVLTASKALGIRRVVLASSAHVYAGQCGRGVREDAQSSAENLYAQTKIDVEKLAAVYARSGLEVVIGRPCLTYGPNARFNLFKLMQAIHRGRYFHVGHLSVERSFCSAYSAAAAFVFLAENGKSGEAYNIADEKPSLLEDFTNDLADRMHRPRPRRVPHPLLWTAAAGFSLLSFIGIAGPITLTSLRKLTQSFSISVDKLTQAGFVWPDRGDRARADMVHAFLAGVR